jgi:hypothetical protein
VSLGKPALTKVVLFESSTFYTVTTYVSPFHGGLGMSWTERGKLAALAVTISLALTTFYAFVYIAVVGLRP